MPDRPLLVLRADAGESVGSGHLMRCVALAQAWMARGGEVTVVAAALPERWRARVEREGIGVVAVLDNAAFLRHVEAVGPAWVALDGYQLPTGLQPETRARGARVLVIDDHGTVGKYDADLVLDQNMGASAGAYVNRNADASLLLGLRYVLLRREFWDATAPVDRVVDDVRSVVVSLGGAADDRWCALAERAIDAAGLGGVTRLLHRDPTDDMAAVLARCDLALSAGGTTSYELCRMGVPSLLFAVADNQQPVVDALVAVGAAWRAPHDEDELVADVRRLAADADERRRLAKTASALVDGRGSRRVVTHMRSFDIVLRPAAAADAQLLFTWANDAAVRAASFDSAPIGWDEHLRWFDRRLQDPDSRLFIASDADGLIGLFRVARQGDRGEVGVSVAAERRGEGLASALIAAGSRALLTMEFVSTVDAYIKRENEASITAFSDAGYTFEGAADAKAPGALHYAARRDH